MRQSCLILSLALSALFPLGAGAEALYELAREGAKRATPDPGPGFHRIDPLARTKSLDPGTEIELPVGSGGTYHMRIDRSHRNADGSTTLVGRVLEGQARGIAVVTIGQASLFALFDTPRGRYQVTTDKDDSLLIDTGHPGVRHGGLEGDFTAPSTPAAGQFLKGPDHGKANGTVIDLLLIHTPDMAERYPGSMLDSRLAHLVAVANQIFANSQTDVAFRLVGTRQVDYTGDGTVFTARNDMRKAIQGESPARGLEQLRNWRRNLGADLVSLIWPHDIPTRAACGVAFLFGDGDDTGVNVVNDGEDDAFPLLASEHQDSDGDGVGNNADAFPFDRSESRDTDGDGIGNIADPDDDGDGVPDLTPGSALEDHELWVISAGNDRVLRVDPAEGKLIGVGIDGERLPAPFDWEARSLPQSLSFQSDIAVGNDGRVYLLVNKDVRRFDRHARRQVDVFVESFETDDKPHVISGFPNGLTFNAAGDLFMSTDETPGLQRFRSLTGAMMQFNEDSVTGRTFAPPRELAIHRGQLYVVTGEGVIESFHAATGSARQTVLSANASALDDPTDMITGPGGDLLIADFAGNAVWRLNPDNGAAPSRLISGGELDGPTALAIGPDGALYVSSDGSDAILRYDAETGAFDGRLDIEPGTMLDSPQDMVFVRRIADDYPEDPKRTIRPQGGNWHNPNRSGHGIELQTAGDRLVRRHSEAGKLFLRDALPRLRRRRAKGVHACGQPGRGR